MLSLSYFYPTLQILVSTIEKWGIIEFLLGPPVIIQMDTTVLWLVDPNSHPPLSLVSTNHSMVMSILNDNSQSQ